MIKCLRARRGNVHRKQNCFRGVLLFKTQFAEFCVKSVCKTEPWNWAVRTSHENSGFIHLIISQTIQTKRQKVNETLFKLNVSFKNMFGLGGRGTSFVVGYNILFMFSFIIIGSKHLFLRILVPLYLVCQVVCPA